MRVKSENLPGPDPTGIKLHGTEPQNTESAGGGNFEVLKNSQHFLLRHSLLDIRYSKNMITHQLVDDLRRIVGDAQVSVSRAETELYSYDASLAKGQPGVILVGARELKRTAVRRIPSYAPPAV